MSSGPASGPAGEPRPSRAAVRRPPARSAASPLLGVAGLGGLVVLLELAPRVGLVSPDYLPPASEIARTLAAEATTGAFWVAIGHTLEAWAIGLAIAFTSAVAVGFIIDGVPRMRALTASTIEFMRPIPSVALVPVATLLFHATIRSTLLLVVYASFWQVLIQVLAGAADVDPIARDTARSYRLGRWATLVRVTWPSALPYVLTGLRLAASVALILAITAELVIGSPGLGREMANAHTSGAVSLLYALMVTSGLIGVAVNVLVRMFERRVLAWHSSVRGEVAP